MLSGVWLRHRRNGPGGHAAQIGRRAEPRRFLADHHQRFAAHLDLLPAVAEDAHAEAAQPAAHLVGGVPDVVVAEDGEGGRLPAQPAQDRHDPADVVEAVGQVAGDGDEVRLPGGAAVHHGTEIGAIRRAAQVQVAQVQDRQAVPRRRQPRQVQRPLGVFDLQDLIERQQRLEALLAGAGRSAAELFRRRRRPRIALSRAPPAAAGTLRRTVTSGSSTNAAAQHRTT